MVVHPISVDGFLQLCEMGVLDLKQITCEEIEKLPEKDRVSMVKIIARGDD